MPVENDFLAVAVGVSANVDSQATFAGSGYQTNGFVSGIAISSQINKCLRQATSMSAALAAAIAQVVNTPVLDNGSIAELTLLILQLIRSGGSGLVAVAFASNPVFNAQLGNTFEITLTGNVTSSTFTNILPGALYTWIIHQDGVGSRTFAWPANVPGDTIDPGVSATSVQCFMLDGGGTMRPISLMTVS